MAKKWYRVEFSLWGAERRVYVMSHCPMCAVGEAAEMFMTWCLPVDGASIRAYHCPNSEVEIAARGTEEAIGLRAVSPAII